MAGQTLIPAGDFRTSYAADTTVFPTATSRNALIAGIVLMALGIKKTIGHVDEPLATVPAVALCGGVALYLLGHIAVRLRNIGTLNRQRLVAAVACAALIPLATNAAALIALAALAAICCALIAYEAIRFGEARGRIRAAHASFAADREMLLIEGTGHAGVGAVINLSNADVAAMLGAPAVIVSEGGVGRPIDEIVLNKALFERAGVQVAGAIVNKVDLLAKPDLARTLELGLRRHGVRLLGVLPYRPILSNPTLAMVLEGVHGETIHPGPDLDQVIGGVSIGAMEPQHMLQRIGPRALVIVPGDREDVIGAIVHAHRIRAEAGGDALGLVLTGGYRPRQTVLDAIRYADLFATLVDQDTYQVASEVHDLLVKTHAADTGKIEEIKALVWEHLAIDRILEVATEAVIA